MTDAKQTKCPHCGSSFRITDVQLAAKGGSVRCGSCLQVFRADQHLVGAPVPAPVPAAPVAAKPRAKGGPADESWAMDLMGESDGTTKNSPDDWKLPEPGGASDDFGFSEDDISSFIATGGDAPAEAAPGKSMLFDDELSDQLEAAGNSFLEPERDTHRLSENADESWAQDILSELETKEHKAARSQDLEIVDSKSKPGPKNPKLAAAVGMRAAPVPSPSAPPPPPVRKPAPVPGDDFLGDDADVLSFLDDDDLSQPVGNAPTPPAAANPFALERPLAHVDAPVTLKPQRDPVRWGYVLGWGFLCLAALLLLASQYIFFNFDKLATTPSIRPVFERVCASLDCYLPDIPDPTRLKVDELVVRKHPTVPGALVVDAILKNHARFPQPFPSLRLRFSNSTEEVIASRLLKPSEYLRGEARRLRRMPPDTPIRISIEVVDPGQDAISYGLDPVL